MNQAELVNVLNRVFPYDNVRVELLAHTLLKLSSVPVTDMAATVVEKMASDGRFVLVKVDEWEKLIGDVTRLGDEVTALKEAKGGKRK